MSTSQPEFRLAIEDPVDFYADLLVKPQSNPQQINLGHLVNSIEMDPTQHESVLSKQTGRKHVPKNATVWWASYRARYEIAYVGCTTLNKITSPEFLYEHFCL